MALSLVLLEHMQDKGNANMLKEEFLRSLMAGSVASEISPVQKDREEAFIGSMFQSLGRMLAQYYFPEEARAVRALMSANRETVNEVSASVNVLGLSYEALGVGVAKAGIRNSWPESEDGLVWDMLGQLGLLFSLNGVISSFSEPPANSPHGSVTSSKQAAGCLQTGRR